MTPITPEPWPRPIPRGPAVGDTVELGTTRYRITALHPTDNGPLAHLTPTGGMTFVQTSELRWDGATWRPETEAELRAAYGDR